jgi:FtsP/CotA-like multicopper oxidase with cupredoxin domain
MDGVPGISFPGIKARSTFVYEFPIVQSRALLYQSLG